MVSGIETAFHDRNRPLGELPRAAAASAERAERARATDRMMVERVMKQDSE